jgi:hypothetical protein
MSVVIEPFKCEDVLVKLGSSCETQEEVYNHLKNLQTGVTTLAPNSVALGSGLGDSSWNESLNYEKIQEEIVKESSNEEKEKAVNYISDLKSENKKKDYAIYGGVLLLVLAVVVYEFKKRK